MDKRKIIITVIVAFLAIFFINQMILSSLEKEQRKKDTSVKQEIQKRVENNFNKKKLSTAAETKQRNKIVPEDPAKYGIITIDRFYEPSTQSEWDAHMKKVVRDSGVFKSQEGELAIKHMQMKRDKFEDTMERVDKQIVDFEEESRKNPKNENAKRRLNTLYKLKALGKILEQDLVESP